MKRLLASACCLMLWATPVFAANGTTTLDESVAAAVKQHPQIKTLVHNREAISRNMEAAFGRFLPSVDAFAGAGFQDYDSQTTRQPDYDDEDYLFDSTLKLTQNIFDGMDRINFYEAAKDRLTSAEFRLLNNVETVSLDAVQAHIDVSRQRVLVGYAEKNVVKHKEVFESISERVEAGAGNRADEMQARGRVARAETTLVTYLGDLKTAEANYKRVTGMAPEHLEDAKYTAEQKPESMQELIDRTLEGNPLIRVYEAEIAASKKDKKVNESEYYPEIDLELSTRYAQNDGSDTSYLQDSRAMIVMNWNLYRGGSDYETVKSAEARTRQAVADKVNTADDLTLQAATAWNEYQVAIGQIDKYTEALEYSRQSLEMYQEQFNVGQRSLLDVLDAINEVFSNAVLLKSAEDNGVFALYKFRALEGNLLYTIGLDATAYADEAYAVEAE